MIAERLLERLEGVKRTGAGRWVARCPAHEDRHPSLSIRLAQDGRLLVHDFAGCEVDAVCAAVGLELDDLFPPRVEDDKRTPRERKPFSAEDALRLIDYEVNRAAMLLIVAAHAELSDEQKRSLVRSAQSIRAARQACGLREVEA